MRTWGRVAVNGVIPPGTQWTEVVTDSNGFNDMVYLTTLCQVLLLGLGESPFYANYGIPAVQSVLTQIFPDFYVNFTQQQFSQYFANLSVVKLSTRTPIYQINVITQQGYTLNASVGVPQ